MENVIANIEYNKKFINFKNMIVKLYRAESSKEKGIILFENIINEISKQYQCSYKTSRLLTIYFLDKCDIFEEKGENDDITR